MRANDWGSLIDKLAEKLSVPAAQLWAVLVRQARIDTIEAGVWVVLAAAIIVYAAVHGWRRVHAYVSEGGIYSSREVIWVPFGLVVAMALVLFGNYLPRLVGGLLNPEFMALRYILEAAK